jgi:hypothetical protein
MLKLLFKDLKVGTFQPSIFYFDFLQGNAFSKLLLNLLFNGKIAFQCVIPSYIYLQI